MTVKQKTIGILGGVSWESTVVYYQLINRLVRERLGKLNSAKILLLSFNYEPIVELEKKEKWDEEGKRLGDAAKALESAGADFLILCCNTLHKATPSIESAIRIPFLHIADAAGIKLANNNIKKIGLLGTQFTMEDGFYASRLEDKFGLKVLLPILADRKSIDQIIYNELCQGKLLPKSKKQLIHIIQTLHKEGAGAVLLGCTELGMLISQEDVNIPVYDTTVLHANEAARQSFSH